jgi:3',5'-cyclic AMP phosphodiesterase CpdA
MKWRITGLSDTHNRHKKVINDLPGGDILIHSGDITSIGRESEIREFVKWFNSIGNYTHKVFIAGNHDLTFESERLFRMKSLWFDKKAFEDDGALGKPDWLKDLLINALNSNVYYLENSELTIDDIKIWGSPYSPRFGRDWAFNVDRGYDSNLIWKTIPNDTDIVITHGPIYGYNDRTYNTNENVGCADLYHRLHEVKPHLHFAGHIHEGYGYKTIPYKDGSGDIYTFNCSSVNLAYEYFNKPITFDYDFTTREIEFI